MKGLARLGVSFAHGLKANGFNVQDSLWECYLSGPESGSDPAQWRTELNRPLRT